MTWRGTWCRAPHDLDGTCLLTSHAMSLQDAMFVTDHSSVSSGEAPHAPSPVTRSSSVEQGCMRRGASSSTLEQAFDIVVLGDHNVTVVA